MRNNEKKGKKKKGNRAFRIWRIISVIVLVLAITANSVCLANDTVSGALDMVFGKGHRVLLSGTSAEYYEKTMDKEEALQNAKDLTERINEEGYVLLKNENDALPMTNKGKISVFGKNSVNLVYGGSGSGSADTSDAKTLYESLEDAGFEVNPVLKAFYEDDKASGSGRPDSLSIDDGIPAGIETGETPQSSYTDEVKESYAEYSDAALIVISRTSGEGNDMPRTMKTSFKDGAEKTEGAMSADDHALELDENEQDMIVAACEAGFDRIIIIINSSTSMELGFLDAVDDGDETSKLDGLSDQIDAAIWIGGPGSTGIMALGRILNGEVNPSGRLVDIYSRDFTKDPTWQNFGNNNVSGGNEYLQDGSGTGEYFVEYEEGIYTGYRYYETRTVMEDDPDWYENNVVFPFGYGLSYTTFEWEIESASITEGSSLGEEDTLEISVKVTNTGDVAGKDVVECYYTAPWYEGGIEKAEVVLADYAKTAEIEPGESDVVTVSFPVRDMASYDYNDKNENGFIGYELEAGDYIVSLRKNSHESVLELNYVVEEGFTYATDEVTGTEITNLFDDVSEGMTSVMSRSDFEGTFPTTATAEDREMSSELAEAISFTYSDTADQPYYTEEETVFGDSSEEAAIKLYEMSGLDYDDPLWDDFMDQLSAKEMANIIGYGCYSTIANDRIGKPQTTDLDGPVGFVNFMGGPEVYDVNAYQSAPVLASTWNKELAWEMGESIGNESLAGNEQDGGQSYSGWYAPGMNLHRSPFGGRNYEYYSEDPVLAGTMGAQVVQGASSKGVYTMTKHFALNDQETNRGNGICTWADEQTMREVYLKAFEIVVKDGGTSGIMSSFNRIGSTWAGGSYALLTSLLRDEWGFVGTVICDFNLGAEYMDTEQMIRAGGDLNLSYGLTPKTSSKYLTTTGVAAIRRSCKNILYTIANSNAMNGLGDTAVWGLTMSPWKKFMFTVDGVLAGVIMLSGVAVFMYQRKKRAVRTAAERKAV